MSSVPIAVDNDERRPLKNEVRSMRPPTLHLMSGMEGCSAIMTPAERVVEDPEAES